MKSGASATDYQNLIVFLAHKAVIDIRDGYIGLVEWGVGDLSYLWEETIKVDNSEMLKIGCFGFLH